MTDTTFHRLTLRQIGQSDNAYPVVFPHPVETFRIIEGQCQEAPRILSTLNLVAAGLGVTFVPASLRELGMPGVVYRSIGPRPAFYQFGARGGEREDGYAMTDVETAFGLALGFHEQ